MAIATRRLLSVTYRGGKRLVEPFCHGFSADERELLVVFQRSGCSTGGAPTGWKTLAVDDLSLVEPLDEVFASDRPGYRPGVSKQIVEIHCSV